MAERIFAWSGAVYVVRDNPEPRGKDDFCQYAIREGDRLVWLPCVEGVMYADIQPFVRLSDG